MTRVRSPVFGDPILSGNWVSPIQMRIEKVKRYRPAIKRRKTYPNRLDSVLMLVEKR